MTRVDKSEARESLYFSLPYLIFVGIPVYEVFQRPVFDWREGAVLGLLTAMVLIYLSLWLFNDVAPVGRRVGTLFWLQFGAFATVLTAMIVVGGREYPGLIFMITYSATSWVLLAPRDLLLPGATLILALTVINGVLLPVPGALLFVAVLVVIMSSSAVWISRFSIDKGRLQGFRKEQDHQLQMERERSLMNSDLHDLLGQDLTGISIKADLADRLLATGRVDEARAELQDLARLSRQSLEDVRAVVKRGREWSLEREIASAADLLTARDITLHLDRSEIALPGPQAGLLARVVRESVTNLLHHSEPANCWITLEPTRLTIENDGYTARRSTRSAGSQHGLVGLRDAAQQFGTLRWGPAGRGWRVDLEIAS